MSILEKLKTKYCTNYLHNLKTPKILSLVAPFESVQLLGDSFKIYPTNYGSVAFR